MKIKRLDTSLEENIYLLQEMQLKCFPSDVVCDTTQGAWWVAYDADEPIGFGGVVPDLRWTDCGYLARCGVYKGYRGQGLQKRFIRVREIYAKKMGWKWLITNTYHNHASANSLISCGFKLYEPTTHVWAKGTLHWRKKL